MFYLHRSSVRRSTRKWYFGDAYGTSPSLLDTIAIHKAWLIDIYGETIVERGWNVEGLEIYRGERERERETQLTI